MNINKKIYKTGKKDKYKSKHREINILEFERICNLYSLIYEKERKIREKIKIKNQKRMEKTREKLRKLKEEKEI